MKIRWMVDNHKKIMEATTRLMSEKGYHGASIQMIAEKVGINKSTVFHYFKDKETILLAILEGTVPRATHDLILIVNDNSLSPMQKLKQFMRMHLKMVEEKGEILNLYLGESRHLSKHNRRTYVQSRRIYTNLVREIIEKVQLENDVDCNIRDLPPSVVANAVLGMCNWAVTWYKKGGEIDVDTLADQFCQIVTGHLKPEIEKPEIETIDIKKSMLQSRSK